MTTTELDLIRFLGTRENFQRFSGYVKDYTVTPEAKGIIDGMERYYATFPSETSINWSTFRPWYVLSNRQAKANVSVDTILTTLEQTGSQATGVSSAVVDHFVSLDYLTRIIDTAAKLSDSQQSVQPNDLEVLTKDYIQHISGSIMVGGDDPRIMKGSITELLDSLVRKGGLEWRLEDLNVALGPIHKGDLIVVGARPETGKTSMLLAEATYMASQLPPDRPVLIFNNEEGGAKLFLRARQCALGYTIKDMIANEATVEQDYAKAMGGDPYKVRIVDDAQLHIRDVEHLCRRYNPGLIGINVLDKVYGFGNADSDVDRIAKLYQWARELAKQYCPVLVIAQADGTAEGSQWVMMNQLYGSKTKLQGEADAIITIGKTHDPNDQPYRFVHVPKNKLPGGPRSNPNDRHGYFQVKFNGETGLYESVHYKRP